MNLRLIDYGVDQGTAKGSHHRILMLVVAFISLVSGSFGNKICRNRRTCQM